MTNTDSGEELLQLTRNLFAKDASEGEEKPPDTDDMQELTRALFAPDPDA